MEEKEYREFLDYKKKKKKKNRIIAIISSVVAVAVIASGIFVFVQYKEQEEQNRLAKIEILEEMKLEADKCKEVAAVLEKSFMSYKAYGGKTDTLGVTTGSEIERAEKYGLAEGMNLYRSLFIYPRRLSNINDTALQARYDSSLESARRVIIFSLDTGLFKEKHDFYENAKRFDIWVEEKLNELQNK